MVDVDPLSMDSSMSVEINDYENLKYLLMNEKASPEILPYQEDLVSRLYLKIEQQVRSFECQKPGRPFCVYKIQS